MTQEQSFEKLSALTPPGSTLLVQKTIRKSTYLHRPETYYMIMYFENFNEQPTNFEGFTLQDITEKMLAYLTERYHK